MTHCTQAQGCVVPCPWVSCRCSILWRRTHRRPASVEVSGVSAQRDDDSLFLLFWMDGQWSSRSIVCLLQEHRGSQCSQCVTAVLMRTNPIRPQDQRSEPNHPRPISEPLILNVRRTNVSTGGSAISARSADCIHGRRHRECNECGGAAICQHGRRRERCKECHENSYGGCIVSHEVNSLQGKVVACGSIKHWIHYTDGSTRQLSTKELSLAVQPIGTTQSTSAHSQHQHTVSISTQSASEHM